MLGPANDSGSTALITHEYDGILGHIVGERLTGMVALAITTDDDRSGLFLWKYEVRNPGNAVHSSPTRRLVSVMTAARDATRVAREDEGLNVA